MTTKATKSKRVSAAEEPTHTRCKFPWERWLKESSPEKPTTIKFGTDVPTKKTPLVLVTQLHQWGKVFGLWVYTSVAHDKSELKVYGVPIRKGKDRPPTVFVSPKKGTHHASKKVMAKKKAAPKKSAKKGAKKSAKKGATKEAA